MKSFWFTLLLLVIVSRSMGADAPRYPQWDGKQTVAEYAKQAGLEPTVTLDLGGDVKWEGVLIPAGTFEMGSPPGEAKTEKEAVAEKQHKVTISKPFYMGKYELTQKQYEKIVGTNPSPTKGDDLPVSNTSYKDAENFCEKMSMAMGRVVKVPTEAQWEYACRAGTITAYCDGNTIADLDKVGWYGANSGNKAHPVGQKLPNAWGAYDMHGNIRELVSDLYSEEPQGDAIDPTGPKEGEAKNHVVRGACFTANAAGALNCRSASRRPTENLLPTGFRVMVTVEEKN